MTREYYVSPIIGTGTDDDPYRSAVSRIGNYATDIPSDPITGAPLFSECICIINAEPEKHDAAALIQGVSEFSSVPFDDLHKRLVKKWKNPSSFTVRDFPIPSTEPEAVDYALKQQHRSGSVENLWVS